MSKEASEETIKRVPYNSILEGTVEFKCPMCGNTITPNLGNITPGETNVTDDGTVEVEHFVHCSHEGESGFCTGTVMYLAVSSI